MTTDAEAGTTLRKEDAGGPAVTAVLSIAGLDPAAGAGILADMRVFTSYELYGAGVVTALTVQDTSGVSSVSPVDADLLAQQLRTLTDDMAPAATKTGMLATGELAAVVASFARSSKLGLLVVDPVLSSTSGSSLAAGGLLDVIRDELVPACDLVTPNIPEAEALAGLKIEDHQSALRACEKLLEMGAGAACVTGGHWPGEPVDVYLDGSGHRFLEAGRMEPHAGDMPEVHGSGCCFSSAIVARLALGDTVEEAVSAAKTYTARAIRAGIRPGSGMRVPWGFEHAPGS